MGGPVNIELLQIWKIWKSGDSGVLCGINLTFLLFIQYESWHKCDCWILTFLYFVGFLCFLHIWWVMPWLLLPALGDVRFLKKKKKMTTQFPSRFVPSELFHQRPIIIALFLTAAQTNEWLGFQNDHCLSQYMAFKMTIVPIHGFLDNWNGAAMMMMMIFIGGNRPVWKKPIVEKLIYLKNDDKWSSFLFDWNCFPKFHWII